LHATTFVPHVQNRPSHVLRQLEPGRQTHIGTCDDHRLSEMPPADHSGTRIPHVESFVERCYDTVTAKSDANREPSDKSKVRSKNWLNKG